MAVGRLLATGWKITRNQLGLPAIVFGVIALGEPKQLDDSFVEVARLDGLESSNAEAERALTVLRERLKFYSILQRGDGGSEASGSASVAK